jgi:hypothetical protein
MPAMRTPPRRSRGDTDVAAAPEQKKKLKKLKKMSPLT